MKVRFYRGPFDGKVYDHPDAGQTYITLTGHKKMSRRERHEFERDWWMNNFNAYGSTSVRYPTVTATYRVAMVQVKGMLVPAMHPDGSMFYEWTEPRRKR